MKPVTLRTRGVEWGVSWQVSNVAKTSTPWANFGQNIKSKERGDACFM